MAVSAPLVVILAVQAVPTLLFTSTLSSILLVFYLAAFALIGFTHLCSRCWAFFNDAAAKCSLHTSKLSNRSWWWSGGGEGGGLPPPCSRGVQLAMLFLTLMLCFPPPMLGVNGESINGAERLVSLGDGPDTDTSSFNGAIREVTSKGTNEGETGPERRQDEVNNNNVLMPTSSFDSSGSPATKEELQSCRALVRARTGQVTCGGSSASELVVGGSSPSSSSSSSEVRDCSSKDETTLVEKLSSVSAAEALFFPSQLQFGMQPLYQRQVAFLTIMNSCNGSRLSLLAAKSDNRQFLVTGSFSTENPLLVAPGGTLTFPVCYLPQYIGAAKGSITIETGRDKLVVQLQGEGVESLFKINVRVQPGKSHHYVLSLFNPYNETLLVEEVVILPENNNGGIKTKVSSEVDDDAIVIEAGESTSSSTHNKERGMLMRAGETWDLPAQTMKDIVDFNILLESEEFLQGAFQIRVVGPALEDKSVTLVYPFTSRVSRPSPVMSIPDMLDFGWLVADQASSQPLILQNSGKQSLKVEDIYEVQGDPRIAIDYEKGRILRPGLETEVANITFKGHNQPQGSNACRRRMQRIVVRTNSTIGHLVEIAYRAFVLQCLDSPSPAMAFVTGSTGGAAVREFGGQGISDLLMDYKLLMVLLFCGVVVSLLVYFQAVVTDTDLPTISGDLGKGRNSCSSSSVTPFMKRRDKILKMWGWGALATVVDGIWAACGSALWRKDCSTSSNPDYDLPRSLTPANAAAAAAQAPAPPVAAAQTEAQTPKPSPVSTSTSPQVGKGGRSEKKGGSSSGAAKADHHKLPVTTRDSSHHPPSVKQPKASKFLRSEHPKQHASFIETSSVDAVVDAPVVIKQSPVVAAPPAPEIEALPSAGLSSKESSSPAKDTSFSSAQKTQPAAAAAPPVVERERRRRKKKSVHVAATTTSPASPASPVTPSAAATAAWPLSPKKSDPSLSPRSSGSAADLVDVPAAPPLPKLKVKVLHAPNKAAVVAPASTTPVQQQRGGKAVSAEHHRKQQQQGVGVNKRSNFSEWAAVARKRTPPGGDGSQSYRRSREAYVGAAAAEDNVAGGACFTTSASFPRLNARQGWVNPLRDSSVVPPPAIAPALRAPGAKITKPAAAESTSETGWTSLGFTANPEFQASPWHASSLPGAYDIWGNHFGNFGSQCSSEVESKEVVNGLHKLLVPEHVVHEYCDQQVQGIMSPHGTEIYRAPFSGFFSDGVDSRPGSPALPDQLYPVFGHSTTTALPVVRPRVRVRVPVGPYSPPMGSCVATTVFSTSAFNSPLSTPTPTNSNSHSTSSSNCSFWAHESNTSKNNFPERVVSPTLSLT